MFVCSDITTKFRGRHGTEVTDADPSIVRWHVKELQNNQYSRLTLKKRMRIKMLQKMSLLITFAQYV